ncbi:MAG: prepilin-type N-terminal cleavage/methylation domain-containing protein [Phycisphaerae bacterium]|jgi:type II secretion system protein G|nr:prepilin-type N-terminal cleavage/methylation domain-containing protein [Phycisphaerae bacterium]
MMNRNKTAFTLVEILIVVLILGILAAIVIPQFTNAAEESKLSNLMSNLQSIRAQLELYKMHHNEVYPTNINTQLTSKTDSDGTINPAGAYGPYLHVFPSNPFIEDPAEAIKTSGAGGEGWSYTAATGVILANSAGHTGL